MFKEGNIAGVVINETFTFEDARGKLFKPFGTSLLNSKSQDFTVKEAFCTVSNLNVFRGMHHQTGRHPATKRVSVVTGQILDILIDAREESSTFLNLKATRISKHNPISLLIPPGVLHGYLVEESQTVVQYLYDNTFCSNCDSGINPIEVLHYLNIDPNSLIFSTKDLMLPRIIDGVKQTTKCPI